MIWLFALARIFVGFGMANSTFLHPVRFKTMDGWTIAGFYHPPQPERNAFPRDAPARSRFASDDRRHKGDVAILIHGVGAGHGEWSDFEPRLWKLGMGTLAIDLRGHGESDHGPSGNRVWSQFSDIDWVAAKNDILAAVNFLRRRGFSKNRIGLIGGSIGANLASRAAVGLHLPWAVLLSPGGQYRGVRLEIESGPHFCVAASPQDGYAFQTGLALLEEPNVVFLQATSGHGAQMLAHPEFVDSLLSWIKKNAEP